MVKLIEHLRYQTFLTCMASGDVTLARKGRGNLLNTLLAVIEPKKTTTAATTAAATTTAATTAADTTAATTAEATTASSK